MVKSIGHVGPGVAVPISRDGSGRSSPREAPSRPPVTRLLLIEDNGADRRLVAELLRTARQSVYAIIECDGFRSGSAELSARPLHYDAVLVDNNLGDGFGLDLIRQFSGVLAAPMILLTGCLDDGLDGTDIDAGAADFVPKAELSGLLLDRTIRYAIEKNRTVEALRGGDAALTEFHHRPRLETVALNADGTNVVALAGHLARTPHAPAIGSPVPDGGSRRPDIVTMIRDLAQRDPLTGLLNRSVFMEMLSSAMANNERNGSQLALFYLDLDCFKEVNDTLGHRAGDDLLKDVAGRLRSNIRDSDIAARLGGDEFAIVLNNLRSPSDAAAVADSIFEALGRPCAVAGRNVRITASAGIATFAGGPYRPDQLVDNADLARHRCKDEGGRAFQFFESSMLAVVEDRRKCRNDLVRAIERDGFRLFFQPQIALSSGNVTGLEALLRWDRPGVGLTGPGEFLPVAEESGLIVAIGDWVVRNACLQAVALRKRHGLVLPVSINLSACQLRQPRFAEQVADVLNRTGFPPDLLEVEITESAVIRDVDACTATVDALRRQGIRVALDDFGTGYSSLSLLKTFPVDSLKIDGSFVRNICSDAGDSAIARATIDLGRNLGIRTVAECVETPEQARQLWRLGCDEVQGYLYGPPLPFDELLSWADRYEPAGYGVPASLS